MTTVAKCRLCKERHALGAPHKVADVKPRTTAHVTPNNRAQPRTPAETAHSCEQCGKPVISGRRGPARRFCSNACRMRKARSQ